MLARHYAAADVFVFHRPHEAHSALFLLEACAAGLRIASVPAPGPVDILPTASTRRKILCRAGCRSWATRVGARFGAYPEILQRDARMLLPNAFRGEACTHQFYNHLQSTDTTRQLSALHGLRKWLKPLVATCAGAAVQVMAFHMRQMLEFICLSEA